MLHCQIAEIEALPASQLTEWFLFLKWEQAELEKAQKQAQSAPVIRRR
jgi:hypothetical protein